MSKNIPICYHCGGILSKVYIELQMSTNIPICCVPSCGGILSKVYIELQMSTNIPICCVPSCGGILRQRGKTITG